MSFITNDVSSGLFVYSPPVLRNQPNSSGNPQPIDNTLINNSIQNSSIEKSLNNTPSGYKSQPDENITGEKLLASIPNAENEVNGSEYPQNEPVKKEQQAPNLSNSSLPANSSEQTQKDSKSADNLSDEEKQQVDELKKRDAEVKTHEQAHIAAGGSYVKGGASYTYETGPDGRKYAVGGEVQIDSSPVKGDPQATIMKAQIIAAAALAPAEPSSQDKAVAAQARQMSASAQAELMQKNMGNDDESDNSLNISESKSDNMPQITRQINNNKQEYSINVLS